jgi:NAD+ diphosphatase
VTPVSTLGPPRLARSLFDRAGHRRTDDAWLAQAWDRARVLRVSPKSTTPVRVTADGLRVEFVTAADLPASTERIFLGEQDGQVYFAVLSTEGAAGAEGSEGDTWMSVRDVAATASEFELDLLITAVGLFQWHLKHDHCPQCGTPTSIETAGWTRRCPTDSSQHFPRTDPAVIMLIHDGIDKCLLGRGPIWGAGRFSTLAGFVEPGESLEEAVAREVFEETGVRIFDVRYVASQPWPFPASLMLGFVARADSALPITIDPVEIVEAAWFTRDEVVAAAGWTDAAPMWGPNSLLDTSAFDDDPRRAQAVLQAISPPLSISRYLIDRWLAQDLPS